MTDPRDSFDSGSSVFDPEITDAELERVPALIGLAGHSDSGKTYSALRLARGLVGPDGIIGLADTENRRAKFYAREFKFKHSDLQPPFSAERYTATIDKLISVGCQCVIVDSASHVWEGEGGVLDQADSSSDKGLLKWKAPKSRYKRYRNKILRSPVHMIFCLRMKEKFVQRPDGTIFSQGDVPITDARFKYEMTVYCDMGIGTHKPTTVKIPAGMVNAILPGEYISEDSGKAIADWLAGGAKVDARLREIQAEARDAAAMGRSFMEALWKRLSKQDRAHLLPIKAELASIADEADRTGGETAQDTIIKSNTGSALDDEFTTKL